LHRDVSFGVRPPAVHSAAGDAKLLYFTGTAGNQLRPPAAPILSDALSGYNPTQEAKHHRENVKAAQQCAGRPWNARETVSRPARGRGTGAC